MIADALAAAAQAAGSDAGREARFVAYRARLAGREGGAR